MLIRIKTAFSMQATQQLSTLHTEIRIFSAHDCGWVAGWKLPLTVTHCYCPHRARELYYIQPASPGKAPNSKRELWFLLAIYCWCKVKNFSSGYASHKSWASLSRRLEESLEGNSVYFKWCPTPSDTCFFLQPFPEMFVVRKEKVA